MKLKRQSDEVFVAVDAIFVAGDDAVALVKEQAAKNQRGRARICAHRQSSDLLHEMLIAIRRNSYVHPHKHREKSESFHIIDGFVDIVIFNEEGMIEDVLSLGPTGTGRACFYRLSEPRFHTLIIRTEQVVIHEVTNGPFIKGQTILAPFAPSEERQRDALLYMDDLRSKVDALLASRNVR
jgi:cupin fold WbuC family metalloprotein